MNKETLNTWETKPRGVEAILFTKDSVAETVEFVESHNKGKNDPKAFVYSLENVLTSGSITIPTHGVAVDAVFGEYIFRTDGGFWHSSVEEFESKHTLNYNNGWRPISEYDIPDGGVVEMCEEYVNYNGYCTNGIFYVWQNLGEMDSIASPTHFRIPRPNPKK
jgi:hypothetical protein